MNTPHLIEIALLMLAAFLLGCLIGYFLRRLIGDDAAAAPSSANQAAAAQTGEEKPVSEAKSAKVTTTGTADSAVKKPATKSAAKKATPARSTASKPATKTTAAQKTTAKKPTAAKKPAAKRSTAKEKPTKAASTAKKPAAKAATDGKPETLSAPRDGKKDDLKNIKGVGPKIEGILNGLGIYHYDQVASWGRKEVKWVDEELSFKGRIDREKWISQAKQLAKKAGAE